uniref:Protein kinase domain-containing protein n=1 Tax=Panagrellus redivivus TaxID=6233 RepID=A0A7E4V821_PANRE
MRATGFIPMDTDPQPNLVGISNTVGTDTPLADDVFLTAPQQSDIQPSDDEGDVSTANLPSTVGLGSAGEDPTFYADLLKSPYYHGVILSSTLGTLTRTKGHYFLACILDAEKYYASIKERMYLVVVRGPENYFLRRVLLQTLDKGLPQTRVGRFLGYNDVFNTVQDCIDFALANEDKITGEEDVMKVPLKRYSWELFLRGKNFKEIPGAADYYSFKSHPSCGLPTKVALHRMYLKPASCRKTFNELFILSNTTHTNIIRFYGFSGFRHYGIVTEYFETTLEQFYQKADEHRYNLGKIRVLVELAEALRYLKENSIVHRRVECKYVFLDKNDCVKLGNFTFSGMADENAKPPTPKLCLLPFRKPVDFVHRESEITELPTSLVRNELQDCRYLAPESIEKEVFSCQSDVWQFALVMFEVLSRLKFMHYYKGPDYTVFNLISSAESWLKLPKSTPAKLRDIFSKCLSKQGSDRPSIERIYAVLHKVSLTERFDSDTNA